MTDALPTLAKQILEVPAEDEERRACKVISPSGFQIRHPPAPHELSSFFTSDASLFQTIHVGAAVIDVDQWKLVVDGLVEKPFALNLPQLKRLPAKSLLAAHECFGSPLQPPTKSVLRIGNVKWTGVPLRTLIALSKLLPSATFIWSEGLDSGTFAGVTSDRYQKDLPLQKALSDDVLVAYQMNDQDLSKERGGPVRLIVPGWFGTNSTKWLCKLSLQDRRAPGPYTTTFYNVRYPQDPLDAEPRPVWEMDVNSMITQPLPGQSIRGPHMTVEGWAWSSCLVTDVTISTDGGSTWPHARVDERVDCSWQKFSLRLQPRKREFRLY